MYYLCPFLNPVQKDFEPFCRRPWMICSSSSSPGRLNLVKIARMLGSVRPCYASVQCYVAEIAEVATLRSVNRLSDVQDTSQALEPLVRLIWTALARPSPLSHVLQMSWHRQPRQWNLTMNNIHATKKHSRQATCQNIRRLFRILTSEINSERSMHSTGSYNHALLHLTSTSAFRTCSILSVSIHIC